MIPLLDAEAAVRAGKPLSAYALRAAIRAAGGTETDVLVAEAKAKLAARKERAE
jgi:hypothetical protein